MKLFKVFFLLISTMAFAQEFTVSAKISAIKESGPHVIYVGWQFRSLSDENPEIIRILDSRNMEVPYFLEYGATTVNEQGFRKFPIITKTNIPGKSSSFTIENTSAGKMQELTLAIANTDAIKTYSISGSNDNREFFGLVNDQILNGLNDPADTKVYKTIYLPLHNYKYIRIDLDDKKTLPVNLLEAGQLTESITPVAMEELVPYVKVEKADGGKKTRIRVKQDHWILIDRMVFDIKGPSFYKRNARIMVNREEKVKRKLHKTVNVVEEFELGSSTKNAIDFLHFEEKEFIIEIDNQDNPPLDIASVKFYQAPLRLVADLKAGEDYTVATGNDKLGAAQYDFINFKNKLPKNLPVATLSDAKTINISAPEKSPAHNPWIMWVCIAAGAGIVIYFCISMVRDMKDKV
ncbi:hypothetical protein [Flavobacterium sp.]|uniref:hypothetical protein n=1 Tax=Flavobacterium sp. TaxID=239 RepID=UPI004034C3DD